MTSRDPTPERDQGKAATQSRILIAATELFIERGYEQTTILDVAKRARVGRATVFWHFSDKGGLFREAFSRLLEPFRRSLEQELGNLEPAKRLREQLEMSERFARDHGEEIAAFVRWAVESPEHRESVVTPLLDLNQRFAGALTQSVSALELPVGDPKLLATGLMLAFDAQLLLSVFDPRGRLREDHSAAVAALAAVITRAEKP